MLIGVCCWGITPVLLRRLTPFIDAWTANGVRYPMAAVLYWPLLLFAFQSGRLDLALIGRCLIPAAFALGGQVFWALSHYELPASEIGFLIRLTTAWAVLGSMLLFRDERKLLMRTAFYVGLILIASGFLTMSLNGGERNTTSESAHKDTGAIVTEKAAGGIPQGNHTLGVVWILLCAALFGCYMVSVRRFIPDVDPVLSFGIVCNFVSAGTIAGMFLQGDVTVLRTQTPLSWTLMASSSLLGIALGHIVMYTAIQRLGAAITACCQTLMPFVTVTVASIFLHEQLSPREWLGGIIMIAGAVVLLTIKHEIARPSESNSVSTRFKQERQ